MGTRIEATSPRYAVALQFAEELKQARLRRKVGTRNLATAAGVSRTQICHYEQARNIPSVMVASRLATSLNEPRLLAFAQAARTKPCRHCGASIAINTGRPPEFCSDGCRRADRPGTRAVADRRLRIYRDEVLTMRAAIGKMCGECPEGEDGFCRMAECPLRSVSPLPYRKDTYAVRDARR
jgi:transcriptional regulator with XRE-family HTH domain